MIKLLLTEMLVVGRDQDDIGKEVIKLVLDDSIDYGNGSTFSEFGNNLR